MCSVKKKKGYIRDSQDGSRTDDSQRNSVFKNYLRTGLKPGYDEFINM